MTDAPELKARRGRSPNYPGIPLKEAVTRAESLYEHAKRHAIPVSEAARVWGLSPTSGTSGVVLGAMKRFGLTVDEGSGKARHVRLSPLALRIVLSEPTSPDRHAAVKEAVLAPPLHAELWDEYGGSLPPDATLRFKLQRDRGFTPGGADDFIRNFRDSIVYAGMNVYDTAGDEGGEPEIPSFAPDGEPRDRFTQRPQGVEQKARKDGGTPIAIPIAAGEYATLEASFPLTEAKWAQLMAVLAAMKPALVAELPHSASAGQDD